MAYDQAFREHAVASELVEWTSIGVQLYNFHTVGALSRAAVGFVANSLAPPAAGLSKSVCKSWNTGITVHLLMLHFDLPRNV